MESETKGYENAMSHKVVPASVAAAVATATSMVGFATGATAATHGELPFKTFEWILDKGVSGLLLVLLFVLGIAYVKSERNNNSLEKDYRDKVESLLREQVDLGEKKAALIESNHQLTKECNRALQKVTDALKKLGFDETPV